MYCRHQNCRIISDHVSTALHLDRSYIKDIIFITAAPHYLIDNCYFLQTGTSETYFHVYFVSSNFYLHEEDRQMMAVLSLLIIQFNAPFWFLQIGCNS